LAWTSLANSVIVVTLLWSLWFCTNLYNLCTAWGWFADELPSTPAVRVCDKIFFVNELLQDCLGMYFIPERFFYGSYPLDAPSAVSDPTLYPKELCALGRKVGRTDVRHDEVTRWCTDKSARSVLLSVT